MQRIKVNSSSIKSVGYNADTKTLEIEFSQGAVYQYPNVPKEIYDGLLLAASAGSFFSTNIKKQYVGTKVE